MDTPSLHTSTPSRMQRIGKWVPGLNAVRHYRREWLVRDLVTRIKPTPFWVLVAAETITDVDATAADMLVDMDEELNATGNHLNLAELKAPVRDKIERYGLYETIDRRHFYPTIVVAIEEFHQEWQTKEEEHTS